ncbi:MAG: HAMP domain-containing protein, partial [Oscillospiraceae bacterium]
MNGWSRSNRIAKKLALSYCVALLVFALLTGAMFAAAYLKTVFENDLLEKAEIVAASAGPILSEKADAVARKDRAALRNDFTELGTFSRMAHLQVWVISSERVLISYHLGKQQLEFDEIPTRYTEMVDRVLLGHRVPNAQYRDVWNRNMFGVGTPIFGPDGQVLGAVLVQISNERVSGALQGVLRTLGVSVLIAAGLTLLLAARMSAGLSGPILRINRVAQRLSEGDYAARTEVVQHDELGALAE